MYGNSSRTCQARLQDNDTEVKLQKVGKGMSVTPVAVVANGAYGDRQRLWCTRLNFPYLMNLLT